MPNILPYGTQFSPNQIELSQLLQLIADNEGDDSAPLITAIAATFFATNAAAQQRNMAGNCKNALVSYGIMEIGGGVHFTEFGRQLHSIRDESEQCETLVKHILKNLNGMVFIDTLRSMKRNGERINKETVSQHIPLSPTKYPVPVMKKKKNQAICLLPGYFMSSVLQERFQRRK